MSLSHSHDLSGVDRAILDFLALGDGEGCTLAHDIAAEVGVDPKGVGSRMRSLVMRGYVAAVPLPDLRLNGWVLSEKAASGRLSWR